MAPAGVVRELWVYPVKAAAGLRIPAAELGEAGLALDRLFCVCDVTGARFAKMEVNRV